MAKREHVVQETSFRLTLTDDASGINLETISDGQVGSHGHLVDAYQVDQFIAALGALREKMNDPIPYSLDPVPRLGIAPHPNWWVYEPTKHGSVLALRHPRFGWLGFLFSADTAKEVAAALLQTV